MRSAPIVPIPCETIFPILLILSWAVSYVIHVIPTVPIVPCSNNLTLWQEDDPQDITVMSVENANNQGEDEIMYEKAPVERADDGKLSIDTFENLWCDLY